MEIIKFSIQLISRWGIPPVSGFLLRRLRIVYTHTCSDWVMLLELQL